MVPAYRSDDDAAQDATVESGAAVETSRQTPPVDLVHLARQTLGDAGLEREVLGLFVSQSSIFIERLKEARSKESWRVAAHTIKGSARNIGAWELADAAARAETCDPFAEPAAAAEMTVKVTAALDRTNQFIDGLFPGRQ